MRLSEFSSLKKCSRNSIPPVSYTHSGKSKGGLSKGGLGPKGANWAKKGPFGAISALPPWPWGAEELVPIGPEKAPIGPEKVPICPEKARFRRKDFPPIFSENLGLKPPFVSPPLDFPNTHTTPILIRTPSPSSVRSRTQAAGRHGGFQARASRFLGSPSVSLKGFLGPFV